MTTNWLEFSVTLLRGAQISQLDYYFTMQKA
jgi:hypothetical protein